jgi:hypothetical protein
MPRLLTRALLLPVGMFLVIPATIALAHGQPVIALSAPVAAAGSAITVTGTEMEAGEVFTVTLEGPGTSIPLGRATATGAAEEGGFTAEFTLPADAPPGSYQVQGKSAGGETASADLTVTAPSDRASAAPATVREATGEQHVLDRRKPVGEVIGVIAVALLSVFGGYMLVRKRA